MSSTPTATPPPLRSAPRSGDQRRVPFALPNRGLDTIEFFPPADGAPSFGGNVQIGAANNGTGAGSLEFGPHNNVHGEVGGDEGMRTFRLTAPGVIKYHCSLHP